MSGHCNICGAWGCVEASCPEARPGSETAREHGCTCSGIDNHYGCGFYCYGDGPLYLYNVDCPLHGEPATVLGALVEQGYGRQE